MFPLQHFFITKCKATQFKRLAAIQVGTYIKI